MLTPDGGVVVVVGGSAWASVARRGSREQDANKTRLALPLPLFLKCFHSTTTSLSHSTIFISQPAYTFWNMAKKTKDDVPNPNSVSNRDILQRFNFLYQASALLGMLETPPKAMEQPIPATLTGKARREEKRRRNRDRHSTAPIDLSRTYVRSMKAIGQKTNMRLYVVRRGEPGL